MEEAVHFQNNYILFPKPEISVKDSDLPSLKVCNVHKSESAVQNDEMDKHWVYF